MDHFIHINLSSQTRVPIFENCHEAVTTPSPVEEGCCKSLIITNIPSLGTIDYEIDTSKTTMSFFHRAQPDMTFTYDSKYKMWLIGNNYALAQTRCYFIENDPELCIEDLRAVFQCKINNVWTKTEAVQVRFTIS